MSGKIAQRIAAAMLLLPVVLWSPSSAGAAPPTIQRIAGGGATTPLAAPYGGAMAMAFDSGGALHLAGSSGSGFAVLDGSSFTSQTRPAADGLFVSRGAFESNRDFVTVGSAQIDLLSASPTATGPETVAGTGTGGHTGDGGLATNAQIQPRIDFLNRGIALAPDDDIFFVQLAGADSYTVRRVDRQSGTISTVAGNGSSGSGPSGGQALSTAVNPVALAASSTHLYLLEGDAKVRKVELATGIITDVAGTGTAGYSGDGGAATSAQICASQLEVAPDGSLYLFHQSELFADLVPGCELRIRRIDTSATPVITTIAGDDTVGMPVDGQTAAGGQIGAVSAIAFDGSGRLVFCTSLNGSSAVFRVGGDGKLTRLLGRTASQSIPSGVQVDSIALSGISGLADGPSGSLAFVEPGVGVRVVNGSGVISTRVSDPNVGAAMTAAFQSTGNLFVNGSSGGSFYGLPTSDAVAVSPAGSTIATASQVIAGRTNAASINGASDGSIYLLQSALSFAGLEAQATVTLSRHTSGASFTTVRSTTVTSTFPNYPISPYGIGAVDTKGNVYWLAGTQVRKWSTNNTMSVFAGTGTAGFSGDGGQATAAKLTNPSFLDIDPVGNVYIVDSGRIRRVGVNGIITTVAGNGTTNYSGDGGAAASAGLGTVTAFAVDRNGDLYIGSDTSTPLMGKAVIRKIDMPPLPACNGKVATVQLSLGQTPTNGDDVIIGTNSADTINAANGNDTICSLDGNDSIDGGAGNDFVDAGAGNDTVTSRVGNDKTVGGAGTDTISYRGSTVGIKLSLATTTAQSTGGAGSDTVSQIENIIGGEAVDRLTGNAVNNALTGNGGNDVIVGGDGADKLDGGTGNDSLSGGGGPDRLIGARGRDTCAGGAGADTASTCESLSGVP